MDLLNLLVVVRRKGVREGCFLTEASNSVYICQCE